MLECQNEGRIKDFSIDGDDISRLILGQIGLSKCLVSVLLGLWVDG